MKFFGFYSEPEGAIHLPSLEGIGEQPHFSSNVQEQNYLSEAKCLAATGSNVYLNNPEPTLLGTRSIYSDGEWVWPQYCVELVKRRYLEIPEEFKTKMKEMRYLPPKSFDQSIWQEAFMEYLMKNGLRLD